MTSIGAVTDQNFSATRKKAFKGVKSKGFEFKGAVDKDNPGVHQSLRTDIIIRRKK